MTSSPPRCKAARPRRSCIACPADLAERRAAAAGRRHHARAGGARPGRAGAHQGEASSPSPAASARPAPRRRCASRWRTAGSTYATTGNLNNQWGVPLSPGATCRATSRLRRVRARHEPCRRDRPAVAAGAAGDRDHHHGRAGASRVLRVGRSDRRRQGGDLRRPADSDGIAILNRDNPHFDRLADQRPPPRHQPHHRLRPPCRRDGAPDRLCRRAQWQPASAADILGSDIELSRSAPPASTGRSTASPCWPPSCALGVDVDVAAAALAQLQAAEGPRPARRRSPLARRQLRAHRRKLQRQPRRHARGLPGAGADETRPAAAAASPCSATCANSAPSARQLHADLAPDLSAAGVDLVFTAGPLMASLHAALPATLRGAHAPTRPGAVARGARSRARRRRRAGQGIARQPHGADRRGAARARWPGGLPRAANGH